MIDELLQRVRTQHEQAAAARAAAEQDRRRKRQEDDAYVSGGVHWNGYSLETLQRMVGSNANPSQLDMLATEWAKHGERIGQASRDLNKSLSTLMQYWSGAVSQEASTKVTTNVAWITELGATAQRMADPIQDAGGALRSAQDTMPGKPRSAWFASAGGGAAAGFAFGGPVGAAFGAALGGIASAFGFGSNKKKLKRKAVQTMERFEAAVLGIDGTTPQFGLPSDGVNPGTNPIWNRPPGTGVPGPGVGEPGGPGRTPGMGGPLPPNYGGFTNNGTTPSFAPGYTSDFGGRWQALTGIGTGVPGAGGGAGGPGFGGGLVPGTLPPGGFGGRGAGLGAGAGGRGGAGRGGFGAPGGVGAGNRGGTTRGASRFGRGGALGGGGYGGGMGAGGRRGEEDGEHRRRFPVEEDPFATDEKAAPPVIGL